MGWLMVLLLYLALEGSAVRGALPRSLLRTNPKDFAKPDYSIYHHK